MFSFRQLSERTRFLLYSLGVVALPFLVMLVFTIFPRALKQNLEVWADGVFSQQEPYILWEINGPVIKKGFIRFEKEISLQEIVKRTGGTEFGYRIPKTNQPENVFTSELFPNLYPVSLNLSDFLEKTPLQYHDRIKTSFATPSKVKGKKNERKSRYR